MHKFGFIDFDNTLMETEKFGVPQLIARFNQLYAQVLGRELTLAEFKQHFHGQGRQHLCQSLSEYYAHPIDYHLLYQDREAGMLQLYQQLPNGVRMAPNVIETITQLAKQGIQFAIVTNNPIERAMAAMQHAENQRGEELAALFGDRLFAAGDIQKPDPDVYLRAIKHVNADVENSFAVEDSVAGVKAATAAGLRTFGFVGFSEDPEQLAKKLLDAGCMSTFRDWKLLVSVMPAKAGINS